MAQDLSAKTIEDMEIGPLPGHPEMDYPEHERTYIGFITMFKWGTIACIMILILLAITTL